MSCLIKNWPSHWWTQPGLDIGMLMLIKGVWVMGPSLVIG